VKLTTKNILLISPEPWDHIFVSKHHYAIHLAETTNNVFFLNPPSHKNGIEETPFERLFVLSYKGFWRGLRFMPRFLRGVNQRRVFHLLEDLAQCHFDIIWSFDNSVFYDFDLLPKDIFKISHIVDQNQNFQFERASSTADICFGVIEKIVSRQATYNSNSHLVGHGVNIRSPSRKIILPGNNELKALYFGNLGMRFLDWDLMRNAGNGNNHIDFILIGSNHDKAPKNLPDNVISLPQVNSESLVDHMFAADVLFIFYQGSYNETYASPHKMLEYFSSGKPIVSTYLSDYDLLQDLIFMTDNKEKWVLHFDRVIKILDNENERINSEKRIEWAKEHTYKKRLEKIELLIQ
jgi:hypothetical protein